MNIGSLAKTLMKKTVAFAGDGAKGVSITLLGTVVYDPVTGDHTRDDTVLPIGKALLSVATEGEMARFKLTITSHKAVVAMLDYTAGGGALPATHDKLTISGVEWLIEKIVTGPFEESLWFYVCEA